MGNTAAVWLADHLADADPAALSLLGMLHLRTAIAAARREDRSATTDLLDRAESAAQRMGVDGNHWRTSFGPTNVAVHRVSAALDLGDVAWVADHGPTLDVSGLPVERRITHLTDLARALSHLARDDEALGRETVKHMQRRGPVTAGSRSAELRDLAQRCRAAR